MITSLQDITRHGEALYVADVANHVQWMFTAQVRDPDAILTEGCEECSDVHDWRRVYVRA